jgi:LPXTG-site transpeptidase (sortase) family protein
MHRHHRLVGPVGLAIGFALMAGSIGLVGSDLVERLPAASARQSPPGPLPNPATASSVRSAAARVVVPALGVDAPMVAVGVDATGQMSVPTDVRTVGLYRFGPIPGSDSGSAVLSGHVDDRVQGRGAFYDLVAVRPGALVQVQLVDGTGLNYRVRSVERFDKAALPIERIFDRNGPPVLTLVTCGGDFDTGSRSYRDNIVVTADPVPADRVEQ